MYEPVLLIGKGSFGEVYLALEKETGNQVVIKRIDLSSQTEQVREATEREMRILSGVHHPFIIEYINSYTEGNIINIVMEYASNGDLSGVIQKGKRIPESTILKWFTQVALALKYLHDSRILHRDIKPQNIFLDGKMNAKLGDFGISKVLDSTDCYASTIVGSPFYVSPEICQGMEYNEKTDIWSLGCLLYEMCELKPAFFGTNLNSVVTSIMRGDPPPISNAYSVELHQLVDSMLQKSPSRRPSINKILRRDIIKPYIVPVPQVKKTTQLTKTKTKVKPRTKTNKKEKDELSSFLSIKHIDIEPRTSSEIELGRTVSLELQRTVSLSDVHDIQQSERVRAYLEREMGPDGFVKAYNGLKKLDYLVNQKQMDVIVGGQRNRKFIPMILGLIYYDKE